MKKRSITIADIKLNNKAKQYLNKIVNSHRLTYGPFTQKIENKFAKLHQSKWAVFTSSGTGALQASLAALKKFYNWPDGSEVLVPAVSFVTTANIVYQLRLKPVFIDVQPQTFNLNPDQIEKHLTKKTKAIIPVHLLGLPANMIKINKIAKKHQLIVLEDSCDCMFVGIKNKKVGSFGQLAAFSTYVAHLLPTGVGGFVVGNNKQLERIIRSYIFHGRHHSYLSIDDNQSTNNKKTVIKNRFLFNQIGSHFRLTEIEAAIGLSQLETNQYKRHLKKRQKLAMLLTRLLKPFENQLQLPFIPKGFGHAFMMYPLLIKDPKINKWDLMYFLEQKGIQTRELLPLLSQPAYQKTFGQLENKYPVAKKINQTGFYFGCHPYMTQTDIKYIAKSIHEFLSK